MELIQKEEIKQRRSELYELRHSEGVFRDIVTRENERMDYERRWFWELLQNAIDSIEQDQKISIKIEISETEISFSHTGNPFELDDILSLIIQGSSKLNKKNKTGRFGTGFLTTYLLSRVVKIAGKLTEEQGYFQFLLNRTASDSAEFYQKQVESNEDFDTSIQEESYLGTTDFQTKLTYYLSPKGKRTAKIGLECLDELIPITQLFNKQLESVIAIHGSEEKTFTKNLAIEHNDKHIKEWELNTLINNKIYQRDKQFKAYIYQGENFESCIITLIENKIETIFELTDNYPRLYYTFPLIGTEEIGIPLIINSINFAPRQERNGIYLNKKDNDNTDDSESKEIVGNALIESSVAFSSLFLNMSIKGIFQLFNYRPSKKLIWIDHEWFTITKEKAIDYLTAVPLITPNNKLDESISLNDIKIPYSKNRKFIYPLWDLLANIIELDIPEKDELHNWVSIIENIAVFKGYESDVFTLDFAYGVKELINYVEEKANYDDLLLVIRTDINLWINDLYALINEYSDGFPLEKKIILNQNNIFRKGEGMFWDECNDNELVEVSRLLEINFATKFISKVVKPFNIVGIDTLNKQYAVNELKNTINDLTENSFDNENFLKANSLFLKWLIDKKQKEIIKDLKIVTESSIRSDEDFVFIPFPRTEHPLLPPKSIFESTFTFYSLLIREKDCLHEIYSAVLKDEHFQYLAHNGFIHYSPLITKSEIADKKTLELLVVNTEDLVHLKDSEGQFNQKVTLSYSDFAFLSAADGHIYDRNQSQKSSLERFKFLLLEAVEKDPFIIDDLQYIKIEGVDREISFHKSLWIYRAKILSWVYNKTTSEDDNEVSFTKETPSSKNLSELIKDDELLIKSIKGQKQQLFLKKLGIGVSDLIRNTLPNDALRDSWEKAFTNMIISDANPELVQEIFNDPNIKLEYEKRLNQKKLISRNQKIGKLIEDLFREAVTKLQLQGYLINIDRRPFGSDFILTDESSDFVNSDNQREGFKIDDWLIELKATGKDYAAMTPLQAETSTTEKDNYALIVVPLDGNEPDHDYIRKNAKVITTIGYKIDGIKADFDEVELKKTDLFSGKNGVSVSIEDQNIRFRISSDVWGSEGVVDIEKFIENNFVNLATKTNA